MITGAPGAGSLHQWHQTLIIIPITHPHPAGWRRLVNAFWKLPHQISRMCPPVWTSMIIMNLVLRISILIIKTPLPTVIFNSFNQNTQGAAIVCTSSSLDPKFYQEQFVLHLTSWLEKVILCRHAVIQGAGGIFSQKFFFSTWKIEILAKNFGRAAKISLCAGMLIPGIRLFQAMPDIILGTSFSKHHSRNIVTRAFKPVSVYWGKVVSKPHLYLINII